MESVIKSTLSLYKPYLMTRYDPAFYQHDGHRDRKTAMNETIRKVAADNQLPLLDIHYTFDAVRNIGLDAGITPPICTN